MSVPRMFTCVQVSLCLRKSRCQLSVELEVVPLAPVHKVLDEFSKGSVVPVPDEADDSRVVRELL